MPATPPDPWPSQTARYQRPRDKKTIDIIKELLQGQILLKLSNQEKQKYGSRNGSITPLSMGLVTIFRTRPLEFSSMTRQKLCLIQMDTISITWREGPVIDRMSAMSILYKSIQKNCRRKSRFFNISGVILKVMIVLKLLWKLTKTETLLNLER